MALYGIGYRREQHNPIIKLRKAAGVKLVYHGERRGGRGQRIVKEDRKSRETRRELNGARGQEESLSSLSSSCCCSLILLLLACKDLYMKYS